MLIAVLILCILSLLLNVVLLLGFWDVYKTLREVKQLTQCSANQDASKHLQDVGKKHLQDVSSKHFQDVGKKRKR